MRGWLRRRRLDNQTLRLVNGRTGRVIADRLDVAVTRQARRKGLLGRETLAPFTGLVLAPCAAVHTMFMRFAIDVVFVGGDGRIAKIVTALVPWRLAASRYACMVVELPAGTLAQRHATVGDELLLMTPSGDRCELASVTDRGRVVHTRAAAVPGSPENGWQVAPGAAEDGAQVC